MRAELDRARKYERQGRPDRAAVAYAEVAGALEAAGDWASAVAVRGRHARALQDAGRTDEAMRVLAHADHAAAGLPPHDAGARAVLDGQAAHVLAGAGRPAEARRRAMAAVGGFRSVQDHKRADRAALHAARLAVKELGHRAAVPAIRELMAGVDPAGDARRQISVLLAEAERRPDRDHDILVTDPDAPSWGRLAAALAVGAHLAVGNGVAWNLADGRDEDPADNRERLAESWGVTDDASWREQMDALLVAENSDPAVQVVLDRRRRGDDEYAWQEAIAVWCGEKDISAETTTALIKLSTRILRYEARFKADEVLPPDGRIGSVFGYDFGRAVNMARWGRNAGYCDAEEAEKDVLLAADRARRMYVSWADFSAGYTLGRMLRFDDDEFGRWYARSVAVHRILTDDPGSPWRKLAWG
ncbi:hypothetical protein GCM10010191_08130 [Actinomadura vinacea]|uniref:DUF1266 domain-containing protein n=2 Tax=Actinomadura vinacea TaxID=115336 RepID=A0ABN3IFB0_9ACTN